MSTHRILRPKQAADKIGCSLSHFYHLAKTEELLRPQRISANISGTLEADIDTWILKKMKRTEGKEA